MLLLKIHYPLEPDFFETQRKLAKDNIRHRSMVVMSGGEDSPVQALLNTFLKSSYARVHKHEVEEIFECLDGEFGVILFDDDGKGKPFHLTPGRMIRVPAGKWHTAVCLSEQGTLYETKECYYNPETDKVFAEFAPEEGTEEAVKYLEELRTLCDFQ